MLATILTIKAAILTTDCDKLYSPDTQKSSINQVICVCLIAVWLGLSRGRPAPSHACHVIACCTSSSQPSLGVGCWVALR